MQERAESNKNQIISLLRESREAFISPDELKSLSSLNDGRVKVFTTGPYRVFGVNVEDQTKINFDQLRREISQELGFKQAQSVSQIIGDSTLFSESGTAYGRKYLSSLLESNKEGLILYGLTGNAANNGIQADTNHLVSEWLDKNPSQAKRVIANVVDFHSIEAIEKWGCTIAKNAVNYLLVYSNSPEPKAKFGDDIHLSDGLTNHTVISLDGGKQTLQQIGNMFGKVNEFQTIYNLRDNSNEKNLDPSTGLPLLSASHYLAFLKEEIATSGVTTKKAIETYTDKYLEKHALFNAKKSDGSSEKIVLQDTLKKIYEQQIVSEIAHTHLTGKPSELSPIQKIATYKIPEMGQPIINSRTEYPESTAAAEILHARLTLEESGVLTPSSGELSKTAIINPIPKSVLKKMGDVELEVYPGAKIKSTSSLAKRSEQLIKGNVGYNVTPTETFLLFSTIGKEYTYITDYAAIAEVIGLRKPDVSYTVGSTSTPFQISQAQANKLEQALGLSPGSLNTEVRLTRIPDLQARAPGCPLVGNAQFIGVNKGLPGGGPELVITPISTKEFTSTVKDVLLVDRVSPPKSLKEREIVEIKPHKDKPTQNTHPAEFAFLQGYLIGDNISQALSHRSNSGDIPRSAQISRDLAKIFAETSVQLVSSRLPFSTTAFTLLNIFGYEPFPQIIEDPIVNKKVVGELQQLGVKITKEMPKQPWSERTAKMAVEKWREPAERIIDKHVTEYHKQEQIKLKLLDKQEAATYRELMDKVKVTLPPITGGEKAQEEWARNLSKKSESVLKEIISRKKTEINSQVSVDSVVSPPAVHSNPDIPVSTLEKKHVDLISEASSSQINSSDDHELRVPTFEETQRKPRFTIDGLAPPMPSSLIKNPPSPLDKINIKVIAPVAGGIGAGIALGSGVEIAGTISAGSGAAIQMSVDLLAIGKGAAASAGASAGAGLALGPAVLLGGGITAAVALLYFGVNKLIKDRQKSVVEHFKKSIKYTGRDEVDVVTKFDALQARVAAGEYSEQALDLDNVINFIGEKLNNAYFRADDAKSKKQTKLYNQLMEKYNDFGSKWRELQNLKPILKAAREKVAEVEEKKKAYLGRFQEYDNTDYSKLSSLISKQTELVKETKNHPDDPLLKAEQEGLLEIIKNKIENTPIKYTDEKTVNQVLDHLQQLLVLHKDDTLLIELQSIIKRNLKETQEKIAIIQAKRDASIARINEYSHTESDKLNGLIDRYKKLVAEAHSHPEDLILNAETNGLLEIIKNKMTQIPIDYRNEKGVNQVLENIQQLLFIHKEDISLIDLQSVIKKNLIETQERIAAFKAQKDASIARVKEYHHTDPDHLNGLIDRYKELIKEVDSHQEDLILKEEKESLFEIIKSKMSKITINYDDEKSVNQVLENIQQLLVIHKEDSLLTELQSVIKGNLKEVQDKLAEFDAANNAIVTHLIAKEYKEAYECAMNYAAKNPLFVHSPIYLQSTWEQYIDLINRLDFDGAMKVGAEYRARIQENEVSYLKEKDDSDKMAKQLATDDFVVTHELKYHDISLRHGTGLMINTLVDYLIKHSDGRKKQVLELMSETHKLSSFILPTLLQLGLKYPYLHHENQLLWQQFIANFADLNLQKGWLPFFNVGGMLASGMTSSQIVPGLLTGMFPDKKESIEQLFKQAAPIAQMTQMVATSTFSAKKLYDSGRAEFSHETVLPLMTLASNGLFGAFEKWYQHQFGQIPESSVYYWMKDNAIELCTYIPFLAHAFKTPEKLRDYAWKCSTADLSWLTMSKVVTALYKTSEGSYVSQSNKALLQNLLSLHKDLNHTKLKEKLNSLSFIKDSYDDKDDPVVQAIKVFNYNYEVNQLLSEEKYTEYLKNTELKYFKDQWFIGNKNIPLNHLNDIHVLAMRLFCILKTKPDSRLELIAAVNEVAKYDGMKEIFDKETSAAKIDCTQLLTMILNISKQLGDLNILESISWIKSPIHATDADIVKQFKLHVFNLELAKYLATQNTDALLNLTELIEVNGECLIKANGRNIPLSYFENSSNIISLRLQLALAEKITPSMWQQELAIIKRFPAGRLSALLPQYKWDMDEKSEAVQFYTIPISYRSDTGEVRKLNNFFRILKGLYPEIDILEAKLMGEKRIHIHGLTDSVLSQLSLHKNEIIKIYDAMDRLDCIDALLAKPKQALATIDDLEKLHQFDLKQINLESIKPESDFGIAALKCLHEMHHCSYTFSNITQHNRYILLKNIQFAPDILPAFQYLNNDIAFHLSKKVIDLIIKNPKESLSLAKAYVSLVSGSSDYAHSDNMELLELHPQFALSIRDAFEVMFSETIFCRLISKEVRQSFKNAKVAEYAKDAAVIFINLHHCGFVCRSLLTAKNISAIESHADDIPVLRQACEMLNKKWLLSQDTLNRILKDSKNSIAIATKIISEKISTASNRYSLTKEMEVDNRRKLDSDSIERPDVSFIYSR